jgi:hypothetical protein
MSCPPLFPQQAPWYFPEETTKFASFAINRRVSFIPVNLYLGISIGLSVLSLLCGERTARNPTDRSKLG